MADPKYANLPGIAYDQPDCYETSDLPEAEQNEEDYEEDNESIERLNLNATEAFSKFKGKRLSSKDVDFSDRLSRKKRIGFNDDFGEWELVAVGEKETPVQKYQRLKCEMKELVEEVALMKDATGEENVAYATIATQMEVAQKQLVDLRLEETLGSQISDISDPHGAALKKLMSQVQGMKTVAGKLADKPAATGSGDPGVITYQLSYRPEQARLEQTARLTQLEQKLHQLETALGTTAPQLTRLSGSGNEGLLNTARHLSARCNVLDTAQLDLVDSRLGQLLGKMDAVAEKSGADDDRDAKVHELYELAKKSEAMAQVLPQTLERMLALESLHLQAADFSKALAQLDGLAQQITAGLQNNKVLVTGVSKAFHDNMETIVKNMTSLEARIANIKKK